MKIVTPEEMGDIEAQSMVRGVSNADLLHNAGIGIADAITAKFGTPSGMNILVLIGSGNNGTDGLIVARHLSNSGGNVTALLFTNRLSDEWINDAVESGVDVIAISKIDNTREYFRGLVSSTHLLIDAILGTGVSRRLSDPFTTYLSYVKEFVSKEARIVAVDTPTGLDPKTGSVDPHTLIPDVTMALGFPKTGNFTYPGSVSSGQVNVIDIGIPKGIGSELKTNLMHREYICSLIPKRPLDANKGTFGKTMIVGGSDRYRGAPALAARAASKVGVGLVTCSAPRSVADSVNQQIPECTLIPLNEKTYELEDGWLSARLILDSMESYSSMLVGCGLGLSRQTRILVDSLLLSSSNLPPLVVDADALNILSGFSGWWERLQENAVLTPHPGEMSKLTGLSTTSIQSDRLEISRTYAQKWNKVVVLKGANTIISTPNGTSWVNDASNPAMASAGTGDVLAGIIAGFIAQGMTLEDASVLGVYLHSVSGQIVSERNGYPSALASEIASELSQSLGFIKNTKSDKFWHS